MSNNIGFMQGRLSPLVDGKIQAFPKDHWQAEFPLAEKIGLSLMEWTLDQEGLRQNPLLTPDGRREIQGLCQAHGVSIETLTADCFMQAPFFKVAGEERQALLDDLRAVLQGAGEVGVRLVVLPLVDNGALKRLVEEKALRDGLLALIPLLEQTGVRIIFESDFPPPWLSTFIATFPKDHFGINYDIGNSAALGFDPEEEMAAYGSRIWNVHVKDRLLGGTTVPLGQGSADFPRVFSLLKKSGYGGRYILQTARAKEEAHWELLQGYADQVSHWLKEG
ncbi:MAG: sugar phosphate isomerase/epimerase [Magnetococcales bacterium]|nr:sugar phosphate isomerase/epimerase [Magnetococcales bacterium]